MAARVALWHMLGVRAPTEPSSNNTFVDLGHVKETGDVRFGIKLLAERIVTTAKRLREGVTIP